MLQQRKGTTHGPCHSWQSSAALPSSRRAAKVTVPQPTSEKNSSETPWESPEMQHTPGCSEGLPSPSPPRLIPTHHQHFFGQPRSPCGTPGLVRNDATTAGCDAKHELTRPEGPASSCVLPKSHAGWVAPPARLIAVPCIKHSSHW